MAIKTLTCLLSLFVVAEVIGLGRAWCDSKSMCPRGYLYNPHSSSCFRIVSSYNNWLNSKKYCESAGERLAVFNSVDSISWAKGMRKTNPEWTPYASKAMWVGGKKLGGIWKWQGRIETEISVEDWRSGEPNNRGASQDCPALFQHDKNLQWDDESCYKSLYFICEKSY